MNELQKETSPYLLQHAKNPVRWKAWNDDTLAKAQNEKKLIIISIGYSACHWCHVMEHESFENIEVANVMNNNFINIKIDREERPDIDAVYMKAVQLMTGRGGWPMNVVALPDGRPVWGGTYFKKNDWINSLEKLQELYIEKPDLLVEYADKLTEGISSISLIPLNENNSVFGNEEFENLIKKWKKSFDWEFGGMARAPKFMMPNNYEFLLRLGVKQKSQELLDFVNLTLTKMAYGGIFDVVDGGFSRYSVDMKWHIPHFEKMGYDNGQMVVLYCNAYKVFGNDLFKEIVFKTLNFIEKEWLSSYGSFYSAFDADSLNEENKLEEGAFYSWKKTELQEIISDDFELFSKVFNINEFGFWENENYVLIQNNSLEEIANENMITTELLKSKKSNWEKKLYDYREQRKKPLLDDKCLTSWNAIILKGFAEAYKTFGEENYKCIAINNGEFIAKNCWSEDGFLFRNFKNGKSSITGYLEDYAHVIDAFISLYEITLDEKWLFYSKQLTHYCFDYFYNEKQQFFSFKHKNDSQLISEHFEIEDNVIPSANAVMARNLKKLSVYYENNYFETIAKKMLQNILPIIDYASAFSNWLQLYLDFDEQHKELAICGKESDYFVEKINKKYLPNITIAATEKDSMLPFLRNRTHNDKTYFYLCENKSCSAPTESFETILQNIEN
ncbi:thioredoxin domain-containing protein [Flavobacterium sp.]|uniref:thioredoxin domain-containing protein n=1 Tax=Flavobacterium sp. TaxID=239 RepID=UPI0035ADB3B4